MKTPESILTKTFGFSEFRPLQLEAIENVLAKKDSLIIMPTGGGKSLCYQIPALVFDGLTIVVSPLISLMKDQVEQLKEFGINAVLLNSTLSHHEYSGNIDRIKDGSAKLLYIAPESLMKTYILEMLSQVQVDCLAIDEAHCISEWGHDFRPEYRQLVEARSLFPDSACVALTATATVRVREDIKKTLDFDASSEFISSFNRENLYIKVVPRQNSLAQIFEVLEEYRDQSGIIYCFSRRQVDELSEILDANGYSVRPYHAGLSDEERNSNQELFIKDDVQIIVATIAFGMGINKPNVRFVIHNDLPKNIESYYQEIGRAGRDGLESLCMLLFSYADISKIKYFFNEKEEKEKHISNLHLNALVRYAEAEECRRTVLLKYFGETYSEENCRMCDNCLSEKEEKIDITTAAQKFLSCVKRTEEMFGAGHIIDILRGSEAKKILKFGHKNLSTYGIGKEYTKKQWVQLSRQFLHQGLLEQDMEYGSLKLKGKAWDVLKGAFPVMGRLDKEEAGDPIKRKAEKYSYGDHDEGLFKILREKRKSMADEAGVPPYVIFPDRTLLEMSIYYPRSLQNLENIHGIGEVKLKKYGQLYIEIISDYCTKNEIQEKAILVKAAVSGEKKSGKKYRHEEIGELYNGGLSIEEIMKVLKIKQKTVFDNLYKYVQNGNDLGPEQMMNYSSISKKDQELVHDAFDRFGIDLLRPVFDDINGCLSYEELAIQRLIYLSKKAVLAGTEN